MSGQTKADFAADLMKAILIAENKQALPFHGGDGERAGREYLTELATLTTSIVANIGS